MNYAFEICRLLSITAFAVYGLLCITDRSMVQEFQRFGLARFRKLTGSLEVLGALGLLASYALPIMTPIAAGGLSALMFLGVLTRLRVRDSLLQVLPALLLMLTNAFIAMVAIQKLNASEI